MLSFFVCFQSKIDKPLDLHILNAVALISLQNKIKYFGTKKLTVRAWVDLTLLAPQKMITYKNVNYMLYTIGI